MKRICAITMARNDAFFLKKWIAYYGAQLGEENLYIWLDGEDQELPAGAGKCHIVRLPRKAEEMTVADRTRIARMNEAAHGLLDSGYDIVIGGDCDELLIVDPRAGQPLAEYLSGIDLRRPVSGLGLDVGQHLKEEGPIDAERPFLSQRRYALLDSQYTKPVVVARKVRWGAGFHRVNNHNYRIDKNLYLMHFGSVDDAMLRAKAADPERIGEGWSKHMLQRRRAIDLATAKGGKDPERYLPVARWLQTLIRHPFAWLRPYMYYWKLIVRIPERFAEIV